MPPVDPGFWDIFLAVFKSRKTIMAFGALATVAVLWAVGLAGPTEFFDALMVLVGLLIGATAVEDAAKRLHK